MGSHRDTPAALCCGCILSAFAVPSCSAVTKASLNDGDGEWCSKLGLWAGMSQRSIISGPSLAHRRTSIPCQISNPAGAMVPSNPARQSIMKRAGDLGQTPHRPRAGELHPTQGCLVRYFLPPLR